MTAPASLYAMEMAKRNVVIPKATGCPRSTSPHAPMKVGRKTDAVRAALRARWPMWAQMYTAQGMTLKEVADTAGVHHQTIQYALKEMGIPRRNRGHFWLHQRALKEIEVLKSDNRMLRQRLAASRNREVA